MWNIGRNGHVKEKLFLSFIFLAGGGGHVGLGVVSIVNPAGTANCSW